MYVCTYVRFGRYRAISSHHLLFDFISYAVGYILYTSFISTYRDFSGMAMRCCNVHFRRVKCGIVWYGPLGLRVFETFVRRGGGREGERGRGFEWV